MAEEELKYGNVILPLQTFYRSSQKNQVILDFHYEFSQINF